MNPFEYRGPWDQWEALGNVNGAGWFAQAQAAQLQRDYFLGTAQLYRPETEGERVRRQIVALRAKYAKRRLERT